MRIRPIPLAVLIGVLAEALLVTPLYLVRPYLDAGPFPLWVEVLEQFQFPTILLLRHLVDTYGAEYLAGHQPHHWIKYAPSVAMLLQAAIFALVALGAIYWLRYRQSTKGHNRSA